MDESPMPAQTSSVSPSGPGTDMEEAGEDDVDGGELWRLSADLQLTKALEGSEFADQRWSVVEDALIEYGYQVMAGLLRTGYVFTRCREAGLVLPSRAIRDDDVDDLAQETVIDALHTFQQGLVRGRGWERAGGASVRTYFARGLLLQFANIWRRRLRNEAVEETDLDDLAEVAALEPGPAEVCADRTEIRRGLAELEPRTRAVVVLTDEGYTQEEIADVLGVTVRAVEGLLRRHRHRIQAAPGQGGK
ncbi:RNA polymerase sigma factor [Actinomadura geliboluensis]|uniref:RNA polymerase sigma factor n=1 Tax=Actinomadura geliboluensis TaxID=882440 RepID=UPI0036BD17FA